MSEAPKKIWYDPYSFETGSEKLSQHDTQYIRADIVEEMREALRDLEQWVSGTGYDKARAALKRLEGE